MDLSVLIIAEKLLMKVLKLQSEDSFRKSAISETLYL